jgi:hypothetical protein
MFIFLKESYHIYEEKSEMYLESMPITTKVERSNPVHGELYLIQQYVITFVNFLQQVCGFLQFPPPITLKSIVENIIRI